MLKVGNLAVLKEDIYCFTNEYSILKYYLGIGSIPTIIRSPLREDKNPSLGLYSNDGKRIFYIDYGTGDKGDTFSLLGRLWGLNYWETLSRIYSEISKIGKENINITGSYSKEKGESRFVYPKHTILQVTVRDWMKHDIAYWEEYGISKAWAMFGKIFPVSYIFLSSKGVNKSFAADKYAYVYVENKDNQATLKLYQPFNMFKWLNNHNSSVWDLWSQLPAKGDKLIITSSRKDALSIWENSGIPACSLQSEAQIPKKHVVQQLKDRFNKVYVLYDNDFTKEDNPGRRYGKLIADTFGLIQIELPEELGAKDSSDLCKLKGRAVLKETILNLV